MAYRPLSAVVLAAGEGTRMRSARPKPLHRLCGRPMILHVLDALAELPIEEVVVVVGHRGDWVTKALTEHAPSTLALSFVEQPALLGTSDALAVGLTALSERLTDADGDVVVLSGDTPLVRPPTLAALVRHHRRQEAAATLLTAVVDDGDGLDRVVRAKDGTIARVDDPAAVSQQGPASGYRGSAGDQRAVARNERAAARDQRAAARNERAAAADQQSSADHWKLDSPGGVEVATTVHCFRHGVLVPALRRIAPAGDPEEHRLTDVYAVLAAAGYRVDSLTVDDPMETAGVNDRAQLAVAEAVLRDRINERWMRRGVTMWDPERTYIDVSVDIAPDVVLLPGVILQGDCTVAAGAEIGPDCHLVDTSVGAGAVVSRATAVRCTIGADARIGPFSVLHEGTEVPDGSAVGPLEQL